MGTLNVQYWKKEYILEVYLNSVGSKLLVFTLLISLCLELLKSRKGHVGIGYEKSDLGLTRGGETSFLRIIVKRIGSGTAIQGAA